LKDDLTLLITDKAYRIDLGRRARAYCEQVHSAQAVAEKLARIYAEIQDTQKIPSSDAIIDFVLDDFGKIQQFKQTAAMLSAGGKPYTKKIAELEKSLAAATAVNKDRESAVKEREDRFRERIETQSKAIATLRERVDGLKASLENARSSKKP